MKDHEGCRRAFAWSNKAWYAETMNNKSQEVMFGMYNPKGGSSGEMSMRWKSISGRQVPQLQAFDDAWSALALFTDVIAKLAENDSDNITPEQFIEILSACGFVDDTPYKSPYEPKKTELMKQLRDYKNRVKTLESKLGITSSE